MNKGRDELGDAINTCDIWLNCFIHASWNISTWVENFHDTQANQELIDMFGLSGCITKYNQKSIYVFIHVSDAKNILRVI